MIIVLDFLLLKESVFLYQIQDIGMRIDIRFIFVGYLEQNVYVWVTK